MTYDQLGMKPHWSTELVLAVRTYAAMFLPISALILLLVGVLANNRATRRILKWITLFNWVIAVLLPLWVFILLMELHQKFDGGS